MPAGDRTRAFLKVQDGCDFNCSFCTIPLARGGSRSQSIEATIMQAEQLVADGYKEIVLTGVNVGDYGRTLGIDLLALLERLVTVEGLKRIRVSSIEPNLLTEEIIRFVAGNDKMCNHFHIPLQSGDDEILRGMRRRYTTKQYVSARTSSLVFRAKRTSTSSERTGSSTNYRFPTSTCLRILNVRTHRLQALRDTWSQGSGSREMKC
jgi:tRNA A37 methylthiotransferase MiaB